MNRRGALTMFGKAILAGSGWLKLKGQPLPMHGEARSDNDLSAKGPQSMNDFDEQLQADMKLLATRVYSEEGIAMILACEDLTVRTPVAKPATAMNTAVATAFRRYVDAWQRLKPDAPATDVPKLIELLAYRDFKSGGSDQNL